MRGVRQPGVLAWLYLIRVHNKIHRSSLEQLACHNLTLAQFDVLAHLSAREGITQQALSERLLVTKGNVCGLIDRLEERKLVVRRNDPEDRRSNLLYLTEEGKALAHKVVPAHEEHIQAEFAALNPEEQRSLLRLLRALDHSLAEG